MIAQKKNKKGKPVGKATVQGFTLGFSTAMNPTTAGSAANYQLFATSTKRVKKKLTTLHTPVAFTAAYNPATNSVTLMISGKLAFATGGQITVNYSPPGGVSSATDEPLAANDASFAIAAKGSSIAPG